MIHNRHYPCCPLCKKEIFYKDFIGDFCSKCYEANKKTESWIDKMQKASPSEIQGFQFVIKDVPQKDVPQIVSGRKFDLQEQKLYYWNTNNINGSHQAKADWHIAYKKEYRINLLIGQRLVVNYIPYEYEGNSYEFFAQIKVVKGKVSSLNKAIIQRNIPKEIALQGFDSIRDYLANSNFGNKNEKQLFNEVFY